MSAFLVSLLTPDNIAHAVQVLGILIFFGVRALFQGDAAKTAKAASVVTEGAHIAFWAVEEAKRLAPDKVPDSVVAAIGKLKEYADAHGVEVTQSHETAAKLIFDALSAQTKVAAPEAK